MTAGGLRGSQPAPGQASLRIPSRSAPLSVKRGIWGDTPHAPRPSGKGAAPPRPLLHAGIHYGGGQMGSRDHEVVVAARHPFCPAPGATHPCRAASLRKNEKGFGEGTPLALPAHGLRPRDPCFSLILQGVAY
jgi:hypothetical protein